MTGQDNAIVAKFRKLENAGKVRLRAEPEQENYFDVYGRECISAEDDKAIEEAIERDGCWCLIAEAKCPHCGWWQMTDSVGMCTGYRDPLNPAENCYVTELMQSAIDKAGA